MGHSAIGLQATQAFKNNANLALNKVKSSLGDTLTPRFGQRFLTVEAQEAMLCKLRQVRVPNDLESLEITISNNAFGPGVVISGLGPGTAAQAGLCVGDVITEVNGVRVSHHEQALEAMQMCECRDLVFALVGKARKIVLDKYEPGKLQVTLTNPQKGAGVVFSELGIMGLAAGAGVRAGDVLLAVNGVLVHDHTEAIALMDSTERFVELVLQQTDVDDWDDRLCMSHI